MALIPGDAELLGDGYVQVCCGNCEAVELYFPGEMPCVIKFAGLPTLVCSECKSVYTYNEKTRKDEKRGQRRKS